MNDINNVLHTFVRAQMNKWNTRLMMYCELYQWRMVLIRLGTHPQEVAIKAHNGKTPLHVACGSHAAKIIVHSLSSACPQAVSMVDGNGMTPLHVACSSRNACADSIRCLLRWVRDETLLQDLDGDTPLHVACRVGAPLEVLQLLLEHNPKALLLRDREHLTPLQRLWVRHFVRLGEETIQNITQRSDMPLELLETWEKTELLLKGLARSTFTSFSAGKRFRVLHVAAANDCPREIVRIAACFYPEQLLEEDDFGRRPACVAAMSPLYKVRDLTMHGYSYINGIVYAEGGEDGDAVSSSDDERSPHIPAIEWHSTTRIDGSVEEAHSVLDIVTQADPQVALEDFVGPSYEGPLLHLALSHGKGWKDGLRSVVKANPEAVSIRDRKTRLMPFMLAAACCGGCGISSAHHVTTIMELLRRDPEQVVPLGECDTAEYTPSKVNECLEVEVCVENDLKRQGNSKMNPDMGETRKDARSVGAKKAKF
jgi:hypothetical protein